MMPGLFWACSVMRKYHCWRARAKILRRSTESLRESLRSVVYSTGGKGVQNAECVETHPGNLTPTVEVMHNLVKRHTSVVVSPRDNLFAVGPQ
jgi:hypothetical protein